MAPLYGFLVHSIHGTVYHRHFFQPEGNDEYREQREVDIVEEVCRMYRFEDEAYADALALSRGAWVGMSLNGTPIGQTWEQMTGGRHGTQMPPDMRPGGDPGRFTSVYEATPVSHLRRAAGYRYDPLGRRRSPERDAEEAEIVRIADLSVAAELAEEDPAIPPGDFEEGQTGLPADADAASAAASRNAAQKTAEAARSTSKATSGGGFLSMLSSAWMPAPSATAPGGSSSASDAARASFASSASASQDQEEVVWRSHASGRKASEIKAGIKDTLQTIEGVFRIPRGALMESPKTVVWRLVLNTIYTAVCEEDENVVLASYFLQVFATMLQRWYADPWISYRPIKFFERPEQILELEHRLLPHGILLFMHPSMVEYVASEHFVWRDEDAPPRTLDFFTAPKPVKELPRELPAELFGAVLRERRGSGSEPPPSQAGESKAGHSGAAEEEADPEKAARDAELLKRLNELHDTRIQPLKAPGVYKR